LSQVHIHLRGQSSAEYPLDKAIRFLGNLILFGISEHTINFGLWYRNYKSIRKVSEQFPKLIVDHNKALYHCRTLPSR
jgi:hypothetical protein